MKKITIFDTSVATTNLGDEIIVDSVIRVLRDIFKDDTMILRVPTHEVISRRTHRLVNESDFSFVAGTNILNSKFKIIKANLWNLNLFDAVKLKNVILMGVGWSNYQDNPSTLSRYVYKNILDNEINHSVRDSYTKDKLHSIGIKNVINTSCPTMWSLTPEHTKSIPKNKGKNVVMTLTDYRQDRLNDKKLIEILKANYEKVYIWIQGMEDYKYLNSLSNELEIIGPSLKSYDDLLDSDIDLDYVGTRLHAGIRALQKQRRSIIIGIDNRAIEKQKDFNIQVIKRENIDELERLINSVFATELTIDFQSIHEWKKQFILNDKL